MPTWIAKCLTGQLRWLCHNILPIWAISLVMRPNQYAVMMIYTAFEVCSMLQGIQRCGKYRRIAQFFANTVPFDWGDLSIWACLGDPSSVPDPSSSDCTGWPHVIGELGGYKHCDISPQAFKRCFLSAVQRAKYLECRRQLKIAWDGTMDPFPASSLIVCV